jgi:surface carbohydrate biosynthesis protein
MPVTSVAVLMPIDSFERELACRSVTACNLASSGFKAVIGAKNNLYEIAAASRNVVWLGKEVFAAKPSSVKNTVVRRLLGNGSIIFYLQEEGGMFQMASWDSQVLEKHSIDQLTNGKVERLCVWGRKQYLTISRYAPGLTNSILVTGTPRLDLCGPRYEWLESELVDNYKAAFGDYILVCTRFGSVANESSLHSFFENKLDPNVIPSFRTPEENSDIWFTKWRRDIHDFAEFIILIKDIAATYQKTVIILRPHPSESLAFYRTTFSRFENVIVRRDANVLPWIRAAKVVVHSNCTTGVEAVLCGRPVVNFLPGHRKDRSGLDVAIACEAGLACRSIPTALEAIDTILRGKHHHQQHWSQEARDSLSNLEGDAIPKIVQGLLDVVSKSKISASTLRLPSRGMRHRLTGILRSHRPLPIGNNSLSELESVSLIVSAYQRFNGGTCQVTRQGPGFAIIEP